MEGGVAAVGSRRSATRITQSPTLQNTLPAARVSAGARTCRNTTRTLSTASDAPFAAGTAPIPAPPTPATELAGPGSAVCSVPLADRRRAPVNRPRSAGQAGADRPRVGRLGYELFCVTIGSLSARGNIRRPARTRREWRASRSAGAARRRRRRRRRRTFLSRHGSLLAFTGRPAARWHAWSRRHRDRRRLEGPGNARAGERSLA